MPPSTSGAVVVGVKDAQDVGPLAWAAERAEYDHRPLVLVHATGSLGYEPRVRLAPDQGASPEVQRLRASGFKALTPAIDYLARHRPGLGVTRLVRLLDPAGALLAAATEAHLVVVGARAAGLQRARMSGSVLGSLIERCPAPLLVVPPKRAGRGRSGRVARGVVVGLDLTTRSRAIDFAFREASMHQWPLHVIHAWQAEESPRRQRTSPSCPEVSDRWRAVTEVAARLRERYPDVPLELRVAHGVTADCLVEAARNRDLVVLGRCLDGVDRGQTARTVVERTHAAVAVVPD